MIRRRRPLFAGVADATLFRRLATVGAALVLALLSCGREPTAPQTRDIAPRFARGFSFSAVFPQLAGSSAFADLVDFNRVHILLHRVDGGVALDTMVTFPPGAESLTLSFDIRLAPGTPATGERLSLDLAYLNAAGAIVFTGGPVFIFAVPSVAGAPPPPPVTVPVVYTGPGSTARTVRISPRTLSVNTGAPFAFSAVGLDATGATVAGTPIAYTVLDPTRATLASSTAGAGTALGVRGTARIAAQLINGAADTATLTINPVASAIAAVSGNGQSGIVGKPTPRPLAQPLVVRVTAADGLGVAGVPVTFAAANGGSVTPATATTDANGNAQTSWTLGLTALSQTATASAAGLAGSPVTFSATGTLLPATRLSLSSGPAAGSSIPAGTGIGMVVTALDTDGDLVSSFTGTVNVALSANPSGGTLAGASSVSAVAGVASFTALNIIKPGTGYALQATSGSLTPVATPSFNIVPGAAASLVLLGGGGQTSAAGATLAPVTALVTDVNGNAKAGVTVSFGVASGGGTVTPATAVTDAGGRAVATWTLGSIVGAQTLGISSSGVPSLTVTATAFSALQTWVITQQPSASLVAGAAIAPAVVAELHDAVNALVTGFNGSATAAVGTNPGGSTLGGTATVTAVRGVATFPGLTLNKAGAGYTLTVNSTGAAAATSTPFSVTAGAASLLSISSGNAQTGALSAVLGQPIVALVTDANGNPKAAVTVAFAVTAGGGSVSLATGTTDATGRLSTTWTLGATVGAQTLDVTSTGLPTVSASATGTSTVPAWVVTAQPGATQVAGTVVTPALVAELRNAVGAVATTFNGTATISLGANPGTSTLGGTVSVTAVNGVATFSTATLNKAGSGYTLVVGSTGATSGTSNAFTVVAATAATLTLQSGDAQVGVLGAALGAPLVAKVVDAFQNPVAGTTVTFAVATGGGAVGTPSATTNASGTASSTWTLGASGAQTLTITSAGLVGSPITATANTGAGTITQTLVSPPRDTVTALGLTRQLAAQARDAASANVAGTFTWVSRSPTVATVGATGLVTAVTNGSAYIVATEVGGTRDSALIVVQQRVATVLVTPGTRSLYAGAGFTFTAQAVDGNNRAMATQPTFTWSSTVPSAATVNASTGVVAAVAIGSTQIKATSGTAVGVSNVSVLTPITRIDVTVDSTNAVAPDNFTMTSLGQLRTYRALARDTLLNPMTGVAFTWASTNASVAALDLITATTTRATSAANGITSIQASAQGVQGTATLNVSQVLASVELTPATATVAIAGTTSMLARGKDANNRYISGGSFTYSSAGPTIATIGATSGLVTGVANGTANITAVAGSITSNTAVVTVSSSGPAVISFGRDTIGVGRGTALSVPILLSKPSAAPVTVNLAVADTFAYWSSASVTIPVGATSANATLNGRNAGTTRITAVDAGTTGYASASSVVAVQANLRLSTTYFNVTVTDQANTQVLLSDPSPAGGTYVTFAYGTAGKATVSPDPAFIPAGQLAADIVIRGVAAGSTTITPSAVGVTGAAANVNVAAAVLTLNNTFLRLGAGQYEPNEYVYVPNYLTNALTVSLASTNTVVASAAPSVTIPAGNNYIYWTLNALTTGSATINATAPGWTSTAVSVVSTTPALRVSGGGTINTTAPAQGLYVYSADSALGVHNRTSSLAVRVSSSDATVIRVLDTLVTIAAGTYYNYGGRVIPGGTGGTAWIKVTASGHTADSVQYTVNGPALALNYSTRMLGVGQSETGQYVYIPNAIATPLVVRLVNTDTTKAATDSTVTIPVGSNSAYFTLRGRGVGSSTVTATATGYTSSAAATNIVTTPRLRLTPGTVNAFSSNTTTQVYVADSLTNVHNRLTDLTVTLRSSDTTKLRIDTSVVIPAGYYYAPSSVHITAVDTGTVKIYASAPGHATDSATWTVNPVNVRMSFRNYRIGARQHRNLNEFYVYTPDSRSVAVPVTITQRHASTVALSTTAPTIAAGTNYAYFTFAGLAAGGDTIIATAAGYRPDTSYISVTRPELRVSNLPGTATTTNPPVTLTLYTTDSVGNAHYASDTVVIRAVSSNPNVIQPSQAYFRVLKDQYYANPVVQYIGVGSATMTYSDSANTGYPSVTTNAVTVTGPSLALSSSGIMLGTGQNTGSSGLYVYTPNNVGTPLTVRLVSTGIRVATVPDSLIIPAGSNYAYFGITAGDTIGTVQIQATATGYSPTSMTTQVTIPVLTLSVNTQLNTTSLPSSFTVYARDANGSVHYVNAPLAVTLASSATGVATIDSTTITIPVGQYYSSAARWTPGAVGTASLTASDARAIRYPYTTATSNVSVVLPSVAFSLGTMALGIGQYQDPYVYVPDNVRGSPLTVSLSHVGAARSSVPSSVVIPVGTNYVYFRTTGTATGPDTIAASASGFTGARTIVTSGPGRIDPLSGWPSTLRAGDSTQVYLYTRSPSSNTNNVVAATTFTLAPNANIQFVSGGATSAAITSIVVPADGYYATFWVKAVTAGTGTASITNANYTTYTNSISVTP